MNDIYKRRIRVECKPDELKGYMLTVHDADTGEEITNFTDVEMHLHVSRLNTATVIYLEEDEQRKPIEKTGITANPEVAVTAMETMPLIEQLRAEVQMYRDADIARIRRKHKREKRQNEIRVLVDKALYAAIDSSSLSELEQHREMVQIAKSLMRDINEYAGIVPAGGTGSLYGYAHGEPNDG